MIEMDVSQITSWTLAFAIFAGQRCPFGSLCLQFLVLFRSIEGVLNNHLAIQPGLGGVMWP